MNTEQSNTKNAESPVRSSSLIRLFPALITVILGISLVLFSMQIRVDNVVSEKLSLYAGISGLILAFLGAGQSFLFYLKGKPEENGTSPLLQSIEAMRHDISRVNIEEDIVKLKGIFEEFLINKPQTQIGLDPNDLGDIVQSIKNQINENVASEIFEEIKKNVSKLRISSSQISELRSIYHQTKKRLIGEVDALSRRANLNLVIGTLTTIFAIGLLAFIVLTSNIYSGDLNAFLWHYVPRFSVVIFIEVFSFFFLKLYRKSLDEIKYFQNEITNLDSHIIALESALIVNDTSQIGQVISSLSAIERNFILKKGESTVELERSKIDSQSIKDALSNITSLLKKK
ncbi:MAG: hypothetical protein GY714_32075 [Desulfobacterales bacterium]|nr:hypothetical protein [Desulfobacterales bacterium]